MRHETRRSALGTALCLGALLTIGCGGGSSGSSGSGPGTEPTPRCASTVPVSGEPLLGFERIGDGFLRPVLALAPPGATETHTVLGEQDGVLWLLEDGVALPDPYLDLSERVLAWLEDRASPEEGLLGLAFHPHHATNGRLFVHYTRSDHATELVELTVDAQNPERADPDSLRVVLVVPQFTGTHHGGDLSFGPDGYLYISLGDGGDVPDIERGAFAQDLSTLQGSILRIDVDGDLPYGIPPSNPFVDTPDARPEIWAYGLRNPWRIDVDSETGLVWIADVGQARLEEVNVRATSQGGANFGWPILEGSECFSGDETACASAEFEAPILEYGHDEGCSITGGFVYRGSRMPGLAGRYFYGDFCTGIVRSTRFQNGRSVSPKLHDMAAAEAGIERIGSFGVDGCGEILVPDYLDGQLFRLVPTDS